MMRTFAFLFLFVILVFHFVIGFFGFWYCDNCGRLKWMGERKRVEKYDGIHYFCKRCAG